MKVIEDYRNYEPPVDVAMVVNRLIGSVPSEYLVGLGAVVLTNRAALNHERRRSKSRSRGRKVGLDRTLAMYHRAWKGKQAWIEVFVDGVIDTSPSLMLSIPFFRDGLIADVFFHELGHHIHRTREPEYREREDVADTWKRRLSGSYLRKRYWYFVPLAAVIRYPLRGLVALLKRRARRRGDA